MPIPLLVPVLAAGVAAYALLSGGSSSATSSTTNNYPGGGGGYTPPPSGGGGAPPSGGGGAPSGGGGGTVPPGNACSPPAVWDPGSGTCQIGTDPGDGGGGGGLQNGGSGLPGASGSGTDAGDDVLVGAPMGMHALFAPRLVYTEHPAVLHATGGYGAFVHAENVPYLGSGQVPLFRSARG